MYALVWVSLVYPPFSSRLGVCEDAHQIFALFSTLREESSLAWHSADRQAHVERIITDTQQPDSAQKYAFTGCNADHLHKLGNDRFWAGAWRMHLFSLVCWSRSVFIPVHVCVHERVCFGTCDRLLAVFPTHVLLVWIC